MTEFERQMAARMMAHEFLIQALIRPNLHTLTPSDAREAVARLERQFATMTIPPDVDPDQDLDEAMGMHRDAQHFLSRILSRCVPPHPDAAGG